MNKPSSRVNASSGSRLQLFNQAFQNLKVGQKIIAGSLITILLVVIIMAVVLINMNTLTDDFNFLVEHDQPVLSNAALLQKLQVDMETGLRGYVITGKEEFLEPYNNAQEVFDSLLEEEKVLVSDNPPQVVRLEELEKLHNDWLRLAAEPEIAKRREVNLATTTTETLQETLRGGVGKGILDELRGVLDEMESSLISNRQAGIVANTAAVNAELKPTFNLAESYEATTLVVQIAKDMVDQETGQRGFIITGEESFLEPYNAGQQALEGHIAELRALLADDSANLARLDQVEALANDWVVKAGGPEIQARRDVDANPATIADVSALVEAGTGKAILDEMRVHFDEFTAIEVDLNQQRSAEASRQAQTTATLAISFTVLGIVITFVLGSYVARSITTSLDEVTASAEKVIDGDLNVEVDVRSEDEVGKLAGTFNAMTSQLRETLGALDRRAKQIETSSGVSRLLSTILDPDQLAREVVEQVQRAFDYYYAQIYLLDEAGENLVLSGGTGDAGAAMMARGHSVQKGRGLVGRAADTNTPILVPDTSQEEGWLPNELLPDTKAEAAVPIAMGNQVYGVLDVQHSFVDGLTIEDVTLLESLASQVAISLQNARSFDQSRKQGELELLVNVIGQRIQRSTSIEDTLQTAIRELGTAIGASRVKASIRSASKEVTTEPVVATEALVAEAEGSLAE